MRKSIIVIIITFLILLIGISSYAEEVIEFDGYWWNTATPSQKLGYIQGFIDGSTLSSKSFTGYMIDLVIRAKGVSNREARAAKAKFNSWNPYNHSFGYYYERIEAFYRSTQSMKTPVAKIMFDLMSPIPD